MTARNTAFVSAFVGALAAAGVQHACISPGSRNTPLSLGFAAHPDITDWSHHDERSSVFFAIGLAATSGSPIAIVTTSGTATAELHPAVIEADASGVPLIVLTADRPSELYDIAAPQTIDQRSLYGGAVRWHHDLDVPDPIDMPPEAVAALTVRAIREATASPSGPVHLNLRFREPLVVSPRFDPVDVPVLGGSVRVPTADALDALARICSERRGVIVAGPSRDTALPGAATALAHALGWPVLSDPISGLRTGSHPIDHVVGSDLLASAGVLERLEPDAVIRIGAPPTSKALRMWLASRAAQQAVIAPAGWPDPDSSASLVIRADTVPTLDALTSMVESSPREWLDRWITVDRTAVAVADDAIASTGDLSEPATARTLASATPDGGVVWTGSSMPIRDVDSFFPVTARDIRLAGNRGANGIDGVASTALGTAATGISTVAHVGDVSMLHDVGALATAARLDLPITFLVVNNDGGGIFHFLPQAGHEHFERHFGTPHGLHFTAIATAFGIDASTASSVEELTAALATGTSGPRLVEVVTDRSTNADLHRKIADRVREEVGGL